MSVVIDGLLTHKLPWDLILIGAAIAVFIELMGFRSLTFAVGVYLPHLLDDAGVHRRPRAAHLGQGPQARARRGGRTAGQSFGARA